ncbi:non-specific serine/threonine protein kinase [Trifolium repens]|nr:non-specific serine/threonine protein kinase [Trifolium repens]
MDPGACHLYVKIVFYCFDSYLFSFPGVTAPWGFFFSTLFVLFRNCTSTTCQGGIVCISGDGLLVEDMLACDMFVTCCDTYLVVKSGRTRMTEINNLWGADHIASLIDTAFIGHIGPVELAAVGVIIAIFNQSYEALQSHLYEFKNEIYTLSKIEHLNLVRLYEYLEHGNQKLIVVEYVANVNLREHLDGV